MFKNEAAELLSKIDTLIKISYYARKVEHMYLSKKQVAEGALQIMIHHYIPGTRKFVRQKALTHLNERGRTEMNRASVFKEKFFPD